MTLSDAEARIKTLEGMLTSIEGIGDGMVKALLADRAAMEVRIQLMQKGLNALLDQKKADDLYIAHLRTCIDNAGKL